MRIERLYYTEACEQMKEIENQARKNYEDLTDEEKVKADKGAKQQFERLMASLEDRQRRTKRVLDKQKLVYFYAISENAMIWAEEMRMDLYIDITESFNGKVKFKRDFIQFDSDVLPECREYFLGLVKNAEDIWITTESDECAMEFVFHLYDEFCT